MGVESKKLAALGGTPALPGLGSESKKLAALGMMAPTAGMRWIVFDGMPPAARRRVVCGDDGDAQAAFVNLNPAHLFSGSKK